MIEYLVDSDYVIEHLKGRQAVSRLLTAFLDRDALAVSIITFAEVYEGLLGSPQAAGPVRAFASFLQGVSILNMDQDTAMLFAQTRRQLRSAGALLADHDLWTAAIAMRYGLILITHDQHFNRIPGLKIYAEERRAGNEVTE